MSGFEQPELRKTSSAAAKEEISDLLVEVGERLCQSKVISYQAFSRLFSEQQYGLFSQLTNDMDTFIDAASLTESAEKRRISTRLARMEELKRCTDSARNFCKYVLSPEILLDVTTLAALKGTLPEIQNNYSGRPSSLSHLNLAEYVDNCIVAAEFIFAQAVTISLEFLRGTLGFVEGRLAIFDIHVDNLTLSESSNKRQLRTKAEYLEAKIRSLKRDIIYLESLQM